MINAFLRSLQSQNYSSRTIDSYRRTLQKFEAWYNGFFMVMILELSLESVSHTEIKEYLTDIKQTHSLSTHNRILSTLKSFYKYLVKEGIISVNPTDGIPYARIPQRLPEILTLNQIDQLFNNPFDSQRDALIVEFLYSAGLRVSELCNLEVSDCVIERQEIHVHSGKGKKDRILPMGNKIIDLLKEYSVKDGKVIGLSSRQVERIVKKYLSRVEGSHPTHPHSLRHACATHLLDAGANIRVIQEFLGHAGISSTQVYTHVSTKRLQDVYQTAHPRAKT